MFKVKVFILVLSLTITMFFLISDPVNAEMKWPSLEKTSEDYFYKWKPDYKIANKTWKLLEIQVESETNYYDTNKDGIVDLFDLVEVARGFGKDLIEYYKQNKEYQTLVTIFTKRINNEPSNSSYYQERSEAYYYLDQYENALIDINKAIELDISNTADHYYDRGLIYYNLGNYQASLNDINKAIDLNPQEIEFIRGKAHVLFDSGQPEESFTYFNQVVNSNSVNALDYFYRGILYQNINNEYNLAISDFNKSLEIDSEHSIKSLGYHALAELYFYLEQYQNAIANYSPLIELEGDKLEPDSYYYYKKALSLLYLDDNVNAINDFHIAAELAEDEEWWKEASYQFLGIIYSYIMFEPDKAITNYTLAIELNPNNYEAISDRGWVYYDIEAINKAIDDFSKAININPNYADAYLGRSNAYYDIGEYTKSNNDWDKYLQLTN